MPFHIANQWNALTTDLGLMLDYDGTLTPIVDSPEKAIISEDRLAVLTQLSRLPRVRLAIVSGRSVAQLRHFLQPLCQEVVVFCGMHGGEIYVPQTDTFLQSAPAIADLEGLMGFRSRLEAQLRLQGLDNVGLSFEDKPGAFALHYRNAPEAVQTVIPRLVEALFLEVPALATHFKMQAGKMVVEILPKQYSKGRCVTALLTHWQSGARGVTPCFIGDDFTDESAFAVVNQVQGISVVIGKAVSESDAQYALPSTEALYTELAHLMAEVPQAV